MSAETLRRAAALMRERAEAATPGPWRQTGNSGSPYNDVVTAPHRTGNPSWAEGVADTDTSDENAEHIASWHPAVAQAVAGWLEETADHSDRRGLHLQTMLGASALAVAATYLGETPPDRNVARGAEDE